MVAPALAFAALLHAFVPTAHADDPVRGFEYATVALEEMEAAAATVYTAHDKRLRRTWGPAPECLLSHARDIDARVSVVARDRGELARLATEGHSGRLVEQHVDQRIRAIAIARSHVRQTLEESDECPLVRSKRQKRRERKQDEALARR